MNKLLLLSAVVILSACSTGPDEQNNENKKIQGNTAEKILAESSEPEHFETVQYKELSIKELNQELYNLKTKVEDVNNRIYVNTEQLESLRSRFKDANKLDTKIELEKEEQTQKNVAEFEKASKQMNALYQAGFKYYKEGQYAKSLLTFSSFIDKYPNSSLTDNAYYWLGECYFEQKEFALAIDEYQKVLKKFPKGNKVADSMLRIGMSYASLGEKMDAVSYLKEIISKYPESKAAKLADSELKKLGAD